MELLGPVTLIVDVEADFAFTEDQLDPMPLAVAERGPIAFGAEFLCAVAVIKVQVIQPADQGKALGRAVAAVGDQNTRLRAACLYKQADHQLTTRFLEGEIGNLHVALGVGEEHQRATQSTGQAVAVGPGYLTLVVVEFRGRDRQSKREAGG